MKIKIIGCLGEDYWYNDCVGLSFEVEKYSMRTGYRLIDDFDSCRIIERRDCEIIDDQEGWLTEEQVHKLYLDICDILDDCPEQEFKAQLKLTGWIKQSKTARQTFEELATKPIPGAINAEVYKHYCKIIDAAERAIDEAEKK